MAEQPLPLGDTPRRLVTKFVQVEVPIEPRDALRALTNAELREECRDRGTELDLLGDATDAELRAECESRGMWLLPADPKRERSLDRIALVDFDDVRVRLMRGDVAGALLELARALPRDLRGIADDIARHAGVSL